MNSSPLRLRRALLACLGACGLLAAGASPAAALTLSPLEGTPDASPATQISILGVKPSDIDSVSVRGSGTGAHTGRLQSYSSEIGASFLPRKRFRAGESVRVIVREKNGHTVSANWTVAHAVKVKPSPLTGPQRKKPKQGKVLSFRSRPDLTPPALSVGTSKPGTLAGDLFLTPNAGAAKWGPSIFDASGNLVWFQPVPKGQRPADFRVQQLDGQPVLTWWQGYISSYGTGVGRVEIYDSSYRRLAEVNAGNGYTADLHEFVLQPDGSALMTINTPVRADLSSVGGLKRGTLVESLFQRIDIKTGLVMYEWHSAGHVSLSESYSRVTKSSVPFDYIHLNSIQQEPNGRVLLSARNTSAGYEIDQSSGRVATRIGGKRSTVHGRGTDTAFQHDYQRQADGTYTVFDDGAVPKVHPQSRGLRLSLSRSAHRVRIIRRYEHPARLLAGSQGNMQVLSNGNVVIGWGSIPHISEFNAAGQLLFDATLAAPAQSYRGYRFAWNATPAAPPDLTASRNADGSATVSVSWNGATGVAGWQVLGGPSPAALTSLTGAPRSGFETAIPVQPAPAVVAVQALDAAGRVLATSPATTVK